MDQAVSGSHRSHEARSTPHHCKTGMRFRADAWRHLAAIPRSACGRPCHDRRPGAVFRFRPICHPCALPVGPLHALAAEDLALIVGSFGERHHLAIERVMLRMSDMDTATWYRVEQDTLHALAAGPLDRTALHAAVPRLRDVPGAGWGEDVKGLAYQGDLLVVGSKGARPVFARRDLSLIHIS